MAKSKMWESIGSWAFLIGIVIALLVGLYAAYMLETATIDWNTMSYIAWFLAVLGGIVGILSAYGMGTITKKETPGFLLAGIALVVMYGVFNNVPLGLWIGSLLQGVSMTLSIFVAPAVGILAIKSIWDLGKD